MTYRKTAIVCWFPNDDSPGPATRVGIRPSRYFKDPTKQTTYKIEESAVKSA